MGKPGKVYNGVDTVFKKGVLGGTNIQQFFQKATWGTVVCPPAEKDVLSYTGGEHGDIISYAGNR